MLVGVCGSTPPHIAFSLSFFELREIRILGLGFLLEARKKGGMKSGGGGGRKNLKRAAREDDELSVQQGHSIMQVLSLPGSNLIEVSSLSLSICFWLLVLSPFGSSSLLDLISDELGLCFSLL